MALVGPRFAGALRDKQLVDSTAPRLGPRGIAMFEGRRQSADMANSRSAQHFQLDQCLSAKAMDKLIYSLTSVVDTRQKTKTDHQSNAATGAKKTLEYNVDGFATFLADTKSLSALLFWKEAEDYTTLFGVQERQAAAEKIFDRYLKVGAEYEVTGITDQIRKVVVDQLKSPDEEMFTDLQKNAYDTMLFELFPAFWEAIKKQDRDGGASAASRSQLTKNSTLAEVLKANDLEIHLFAEFCRDHWCEESTTFLLEINMFSLLFDPRDLESQAQRIYNLYLDDKSEGRIAGISDVHIKEIRDTLERAAVLNLNAKELRSTKRRPSNDVGISPTMFNGAAVEVQNTLNMDVWPRYKESVLAGSRATLVQGAQESLELTSRNATKEGVLSAMRHPQKLVHLKAAAAKQGMLEGVDFCLEAEEYKKLFTESDRIPRADAMWKMYCAPGCDLPVNIPDTMSRKIEANYQKGAIDLFEAAEQELLRVIATNIYDIYLEEVDRENSLRKSAAEAAAKSAKPPPPQGGGCCLLM